MQGLPGPMQHCRTVGAGAHCSPAQQSLAAAQVRSPAMRQVTIGAQTPARHTLPIQQSVSSAQLLPAGWQTHTPPVQVSLPQHSSEDAQAVP